MFACRRVRALAGDYLDDVLSPDREAKLEAHLDRCEECRRYMEGLTRLVRETRRVEMLEPTPGFEARLRRRLQEDVVEIPLPRPERAPSWRIAPVAVAASLVLLAGIALWWTTSTENGDRTAIVTELTPPAEPTDTGLVAGGGPEEDVARPYAEPSAVPVGERGGVGSPGIEGAPAPTREQVPTFYVLDNLPSGIRLVDEGSRSEPRVAPASGRMDDSVLYLLPVVSSEQGRFISTY